MAHSISSTSVVSALLRATTDRTASAFEAVGWKVARHVEVPGPDGDAVRVLADLVVTKGKKKHVLQIKAARDNRRVRLREQFAEAALRADTIARRLKTSATVILATPKLSPSLMTDVREFAQTFAPTIEVGFADGSGQLEIPGFDFSEHAQPAPRPDPVRVAAEMAATPNLFTDVNQWIIKVLLSPQLPPGGLAAPRSEYRTAAALAHAAGVSVPSAWRLLNALRAQGFVEFGRRQIKLIRTDELLRLWQGEYLRASADVATVLRLPAGSPAEVLARRLRKRAAIKTDAGTVPDDPDTRSWSRWKPGPRVCMGLFAAADALGYGFVSGAPLHLYVSELDEQVLKQLGLSIAKPGEPTQVVLRRPRYPETVFRGALPVDGVPTADILQCWLDVSSHPARGPEQAARIWQRVLAPALGESP